MTIQARSMLLFVDTEFIARPFGHAELISLGLVSESDGKEYYAQVLGVDLTDADRWLREHVLPHLDERSWRTPEQIRDEILALVANQAEVRLCTWDTELGHDLQFLHALLGDPLPPPFLPGPINLRRLALQAGSGALPPPPAVGQHHALVDARWHRDIYRALSGGAQ